MVRIDGVKLINYAKKMGMDYASIPLRDGSTLKYAGKLGGSVEPNKMFFAIMKNGKIEGFKAFQGSDEGFAAFFEGMCKKLQKFLKPGTNLSEEIEKQVMNSHFQEMI